MVAEVKPTAEAKKGVRIPPAEYAKLLVQMSANIAAVMSIMNSAILKEEDDPLEVTIKRSIDLATEIADRLHIVPTEE